MKMFHAAFKHFVTTLSPDTVCTGNAPAADGHLLLYDRPQKGRDGIHSVLYCLCRRHLGLHRTRHVHCSMDRYK